MASSRRSVVVIGAGVGGLATALRLAHRGHSVTVLEKNDFVGGRNSRETVGECRFDTGPTLMMMLDPYRKLFADVGDRLEDHLEIKLCDPLYRVFYRDGSRIDSTSDREEMKRRIEDLAGQDDAAAFGRFLDEVRDLYEEAVPNFVRTNYRKVSDVAAPGQLKRVLKHGMLGNLAKRVERRFRDPRLRMLFSFQTMYLGLSPYDAPWVYGTLAYMEYGEGIFYPRGGMAAVSEAIADLARAKGAEIRLGVQAASVEENRVVLADGEVLKADIIVANADMPYSQRELVGRPTRRKLRYSCSAHLLYIDYDGELPGLSHHNVFFGNDFKGNLDALFRDLAIPQDPAFYACASCLSDPDAAPAGRTNLFLLIPVPNLDCPASETEIAEMERQAFVRLTEEAEFDPERVIAIHRRSRQDWQREFNLDRGAAFGISHDLFQSAFMRPSNRSRDNSSLYYVGASTVPGNGVPMVLISAELVEQRLIDEGAIPA